MSTVDEVLALDSHSPDTIGQSEYRAVYETLTDALASYDGDDRDEFAHAVLDEFIGHAQEISRAIRAANHYGIQSQS